MAVFTHIRRGQDIETCHAGSLLFFQYHVFRIVRSQCANRESKTRHERPQRSVAPPGTAFAFVLRPKDDLSSSLKAPRRAVDERKIDGSPELRFSAQMADRQMQRLQLWLQRCGSTAVPTESTPHPRAHPRAHLLVTSTEAAAFSQVGQVLLGFLHVRVDLIQTFFNALQLL